MAKLTHTRRQALASSEFAGPDRSYPVPDKGHAKAALARASEFASSALDAKIKSKVKAKFPGMKVK